jgi:hypothetical protein
MKTNFTPVHQKSDKTKPLNQRIADLQSQLRTKNPVKLAQNIDAMYQPEENFKGVFRLTYWNREITVGFPDFIVRDVHSNNKLREIDQAILAYHLFWSDGTMNTEQWISFSELPNGQFYTKAFQGYTGDQLVKEFGENISAFSKSAEACGGSLVNFGDQAYIFQMLPRIFLIVVCWLGDEDFPTSFRVLFDSSVSHHLPTDACAILGSKITQELIKTSEQIR